MLYVCDTPENVDRSLGSSVYRITVRLSNVCCTPEYVASTLVSSVYRVTVNLSNMCVVHRNTWTEGKSWFICIYNHSQVVQYVCGIPEHVDRRQAHLYIESYSNVCKFICTQNHSLMCVTHLNTWIEVLVQLYIDSQSYCPMYVTHLNT